MSPLGNIMSQVTNMPAHGAPTTLSSFCSNRDENYLIFVSVSQLRVIFSSQFLCGKNISTRVSTTCVKMNRYKLWFSLRIYFLEGNGCIDMIVIKSVYSTIEPMTGWALRGWDTLIINGRWLIIISIQYAQEIAVFWRTWVWESQITPDDLITLPEHSPEHPGHKLSF